MNAYCQKNKLITIFLSVIKLIVNSRRSIRAESKFKSSYRIEYNIISSVCSNFQKTMLMSTAIRRKISPLRRRNNMKKKKNDLSVNALRKQNVIRIYSNIQSDG